MIKYVSFVVVFISLFIMSCTTDANEEWDAARVCPEDKRGVFTDSRDGREYKYTTIGNQVWMAENLNFLSKSSECFDKESLCENEGRLYEVDSVECPIGWHLPSREEWMTLVNNMGGIEVAGLRLKNDTGWKPLNPGENGNGLNECGFDMIPSYKLTEDYGYETIFLTSTIDSTEMPSYLVTFFAASYMDNIHFGGDYLDAYKNVRCVKD